MELPATGQQLPLIHVAIVEDDLGFRQALTDAIEGTQDIRLAGIAGTRAEGLNLLHEAPTDVLLVDLGLPDGSGIDVIKAAVQQWPSWSPPTSVTRPTSSVRSKRARQVIC
jgi:DNA-binding NarL/FixJ family response regulator